MAATLTDSLKKQILLDIQTDFSDAGVRYYAGVGRSEVWNDSDISVTPSNKLRDQRNARLATQTAKQITDLSFTVPRSNWASGTFYSAYDDDMDGYPLNAFFVMNSNQEIYVCLQQGLTNANPPQNIASTVQPTGNTNGDPFRTNDGYIWKFIYSIGALRASKFLSSAYMPVRKVFLTDSDSPAEDLQQKIVQNSAIAGQVIGYRMNATGSGYTSMPSVTIQGDGITASAVPVIAGGSVVKLLVKEDSAGNAGSSYFGSGYRYANVVITGGGGDSATARAIFGPANGLGYDPRDDLKSGAVMFNTKMDGAEDDEKVLGDEIFRQVMLYRNLLDSEVGVPITTVTASGLSGLKVDTATNFVQKNEIQGVNSLARAVVDNVADSDVFYHQNENTGFLSFQNGEEIQVVGDTNKNANINMLLAPQFDPLTGELLYIDNRAAVTRSADQQEDLKIVFQL